MKNKGKRIIIAAVITAVLISLLISVTHTNLFLDNTVMLWILATVYLLIFNYFIVLGWCIKLFQKMENKDRIIVILTSIILGIVLLVICPYKYGKILTNNYVEKMRLMNNKVFISVNAPNTENGDQEVWIDSLKVDSRAYNIYEIPVDNDIWAFNDGKIFTDGTREHTELAIEFEQGQFFDIKFRKTPESGSALIKTDGYECVLDLYSPKEETVYLNWEDLYGSINSAPAAERLVYYIAYYLILLELSFTVVCYALDRKNKEVK